jgi:uncharacterized protein YjiS (DUF1127 family)
MRHRPAPVIRFCPSFAACTVFVVKAWHALLRRRRRRQAAVRLRSLDDRMLKDIGIARSEIDSIVRGTRRRDVSRATRT